MLTNIDYRPCLKYSTILGGDLCIYEFCVIAGTFLPTKTVFFENLVWFWLHVWSYAHENLDRFCFVTSCNELRSWRWKYNRENCTMVNAKILITLLQLVVCTGYNSFSYVWYCPAWHSGLSASLTIYKFQVRVPV